MATSPDGSGLHLEREEIVRPDTALRLMLLRSRHIGWAGLRSILLSDRRYAIVAETDSADTAIAAVRRVRPDCVLAADDLEDAPVVALTETLHDAGPNARILVLGKGNAREILALVRHCGANGYLAWSDLDADCIEAALGAIRRGLWVLSPAAIRQDTGGPDVERPVLTPREERVLILLLEGYSEEDISHEIGRAVRTVQVAVREIKEKLGARTPWHGGKLAWELGFRTE